MGDKSKVIARHADLARQAAEGLPAPRLIYCAGCAVSSKDAAIMIEIAGHVFCDGCIQAAAQLVAEWKAGQ